MNKDTLTVVASFLSKSSIRSFSLVNKTFYECLIHNTVQSTSRKIDFYCKAHEFHIVEILLPEAKEEINKPLYIACKNNDIVTVKWLFEKGIHNYNITLNNPEKLIQVSCENNSIEVLHFLIDNFGVVDNDNIILTCIAKNQLEMLKMLYSMGYDFNCKYQIYNIFLLSIQYKKFDIAKYFYSLNLFDINDSLTLFRVFESDIEFLLWIKSKGVNLSKYNKRIVNTIFKLKDLDSVKTTLEIFDIEINKIDIFVSKTTFLIVCSKCNYDMLDFLLEHDKILPDSVKTSIISRCLCDYGNSVMAEILMNKWDGTFSPEKLLIDTLILFEGYCFAEWIIEFYNFNIETIQQIYHKIKYRVKSEKLKLWLKEKFSTIII